MWNALKKLTKQEKKTTTHREVGLRIRVVSKLEELQETFKLQFQNRMNASLTPNEYREMTITPFHLLPTTTTLVAEELDVSGLKKENSPSVPSTSIVATISIVRNGPFGLLTVAIVKPQDDMAELGEFAVAPHLHDVRDYILEQMVSAASYFALQYMAVAKVVCNIDAPREWSESSVVNWLESKPENVQFIPPRRDYAKVVDPVLNENSLRYLFSNRGTLFRPFTLQQKLRAALFYRGGPYEDVVKEILEIEKAPEFSIRRAVPRFMSHLHGEAVGAGLQKSVPVIVTHVSRKGLAVEFPDFVDGEMFKAVNELRVQLKADQWCTLQVKPISFQNFRNRERGFEIIDADKIWFHFIFYLTSDLFPEAN